MQHSHAQNVRSDFCLRETRLRWQGGVRHAYRRAGPRVPLPCFIYGVRQPYGTQVGQELTKYGKVLDVLIFEVTTPGYPEVGTRFEVPGAPFWSCLIRSSLPDGQEPLY